MGRGQLSLYAPEEDMHVVDLYDDSGEPTGRVCVSFKKGTKTVATKVEKQVDPSRPTASDYENAIFIQEGLHGASRYRKERSAAEALDAADGKMDGRYHGRLIVETTGSLRGGAVWSSAGAEPTAYGGIAGALDAADGVIDGRLRSVAGPCPLIAPARLGRCMEGCRRQLPGLSASVQCPNPLRCLRTARQGGGGAWVLC